MHNVFAFRKSYPKMPASQVPRTAQELEEIHAETRDWYAEGYDFASTCVKAWTEHQNALGLAPEQQPVNGMAHKLWRKGFTARVKEYTSHALRMRGLVAGAEEAERFQLGMAGVQNAASGDGANA